MSYLIAVKRAQDDNAPNDWAEQILRMEGVTLVSRAGRYLTVELTPESLVAVRRDWGALCYVEAMVYYRPV